jgi:hypothetical protein
MSQQPQISSDWSFYLIGAVLVMLGIAFFLLPTLARSGVFSNVRIPWIILYVYNKDGFYFVTSPLLILLSIIGLVVFALRR